jgi:energy-converting hydrogenase Eha subunit E
LVELFSHLRKLFTFIELKSFLFSVIMRMMIIQRV